MTAVLPDLAALTDPDVELDQPEPFAGRVPERGPGLPVWADWSRLTPAAHVQPPPCPDPALDPARLEEDPMAWMLLLSGAAVLAVAGALAADESTVRLTARRRPPVPLGQHRVARGQAKVHRQIPPDQREMTRPISVPGARVPRYLSTPAADQSCRRCNFTDGPWAYDPLCGWLCTGCATAAAS